MIQRSLFNEIRAWALHAKADALEGNLFKICPEARVSHDTDLSIAGIAPLRCDRENRDKHKCGYHLRNI